MSRIAMKEGSEANTIQNTIPGLLPTVLKSGIFVARLGEAV